MIDETLLHAGAGNDPARLQIVLNACAQLKTSSDSYISRNADMLESRARKFFGPRRGDTATDEGAHALMHDMRRSRLGAIRQQALLLRDGEK